MKAAIKPELSAKSAVPAGFAFAGLHAGIKRSRPDLGLIHCAPGTVAAACFTQNPVRAACVDRNAALIPMAQVGAVIVNSGNANALTGTAGIEANEIMVTSTATALGLAPDSVLSCSTGVIGVPLNTAAIERALPGLVDALGQDPTGFADAILTTDTGRKLAWASLTLPGATEPVTILGVAKGSGMIHPNMATTLGYVCTDAKVAPEVLQGLLSESIDSTFNAISVDGDTSTNDTVIVLASGRAQASVEREDQIVAFRDALHGVLLDLAKQVAADGEGATRLLSVEVTGAEDDAAARALARGICRGSLFKCSVFAGEVAGWGRLAAAAGQAALEAGVQLDASALEIAAQGITLVQNGAPIESGQFGELSRRLATPDITWSIKVGAGPGHSTAYGCDLSYDYVRINADEALQVEVRADGAVGRNLSLASYTPTLKHQLIFDGLEYVRRFSGMRVVVNATGAVVQKTELLGSLARDVELLLGAGMRPLIVVRGSDTAAALTAHFEDSAYRVSEVSPDPAAIARKLDHGQASILVQPKPEPGDLVALSIRLGAGKLLVLADDQGLHDEAGLTAALSPEQALTGLDRGRFSTRADEFLAFARHAALQGLPALHLIDGRVPHAVVAELFTEKGIGTMVTRQALAN